METMQTRGPAVAEQMQASHYEMLTFEAVEKMRAEQVDELHRASNEALSGLTFYESYTGGLELRKQAEVKMQKELDERLEADLETKISKSNNPAVFSAVFDTLRAMSTQNMSDEKWYNGDVNAHGTHDFHTSGRYVLKKIYEELVVVPTTDDLDAPTTEELEPQNTNDNEAAKIQAEIRVLDSEIGGLYKQMSTEPGRIGLIDQYARLRIERRKRALTSGKDAGGSFNDQYEKVKDEFELALVQIEDLHNRKALLERKDPLAYSNTIKSVMEGLLQQLTTSEHQYLETDPRLRSRIVRRLSTRGKMLGFTLGAGAAVGVTAKLLAASTLVAVTGGVAAGGLLAAKGVKGILIAPIKNEAALYKQFNKRAEQDKAKLSEKLSEVSAENNPDFAKNIVGALNSVLHNRVATDRNYNKRHVALGMLAGGLAAAAAMELLEHVPGIDEFGEHFPWHTDVDLPKVDVPGVDVPKVTLPHPDVDLPTVHTPQIHIPDHEVHVPQIVEHHPHPTSIEGVKLNYHVVSGEGYDQVIADAAKQMGAHNVNLHGALLEFGKQHPGVQIFTNNHSYNWSDGPRISHAGPSHLNPQFLEWLHRDLIEDKSLAA